MLSRHFAAIAAALASSFLVGACATPNDLDLSLERPSRDNRFVVRLEPPATGPAVKLPG